MATDNPGPILENFMMCQTKAIKSMIVEINEYGHFRSLMITLITLGSSFSKLVCLGSKWFTLVRWSFDGGHDGEYDDINDDNDYHHYDEYEDEWRLS